MQVASLAPRCAGEMTPNRAYKDLLRALAIPGYESDERLVLVNQHDHQVALLFPGERGGRVVEVLLKIAACRSNADIGMPLSDCRTKYGHVFSPELGTSVSLGQRYEAICRSQIRPLHTDSSALAAWDAPLARGMKGITGAAKTLGLARAMAMRYRMPARGHLLTG
jgi:hypothetical protein